MISRRSLFAVVAGSALAPVVPASPAIPKSIRGHLVGFKGGGPVMVVEDFSHETRRVRCSWTGEDNWYCFGFFTFDALVYWPTGEDFG